LAATAGGAALLSALLLFANNPIQDQTPSGLTVHTQWPNATVTYELNPSVGSNVTTSGGASVASVIAQAWSTWQTPYPNGQVLTAMVVNQGPNTTLTDPDDTDCQNIISFVPSAKVSFPTGVVAFTELATQVVSPGEQTTYCQEVNSSSAPVSFLYNADVIFNPKVSFSTTTPPLAGDFDVQSVATHEFGHAQGLDHSGLSHAVMFPFGDNGEGQQRYLALDDIAGIAFIYPNSDFSTATGALSGTVTLDGSGIFASHVAVIDATTGNAVVDRLTNTDGTYRILGIPPGSYYVSALPLGKDTNSGLYTLGNFSGWACGYGENSAPCCNPSAASCTGQLQNTTAYTGKFY
jgi:hypothetical protein